MRTLLLALAAGAAIAYATLFGGPMDGTVWEVKMRGDSLISRSHRQTLAFRRGRLSVEGPLSEGFQASPYRAKPAFGDDAVWSAALSHPENGIQSWQGLVRGERIEGTAVWWDKDGKPRRYTFRGTRKP